MPPRSKPYRDFNGYLRETFGCRVHKIAIDAGLTCPNRDGTLGTTGCIYCNSRGSGTGAAHRGISITDQIQRAKSYLRRRYKAKKFLAYFQSYSNTYAPFQHLKTLYGEALADPDIVGLTIGTRPDCVSDEVLDYLARLNLTHTVWLEYGLQSSHDRTLRLLQRGHTVAQFADAVIRTRKRGLSVCVHVILGLPGETPEDMDETARFVARCDIQAIKIHLLYVVRGTELHRWYERGLYKCLDRETYVRSASRFLAFLPPHVIIQRLTGDPHRKELVAPEWSLEKNANLDALHRHMAEHGLYQGKWWSLG